MFNASILAQSDEPSISPVAMVSENDEPAEESKTEPYSAPITVTLRPNATNVGNATAYYEWRFYKEGGSIDNPYLKRYEEETTLTIHDSGTHCIALIAYFVEDGDTIARFDEEYWRTASPIRISVSDSKLEMPNAFSPNGDQLNDIYCAKEGHRSIVEFKATIYNRYGQKLYEWTDINGGWDGTYGGRAVKDGVYYVHVRAKGADGHVYNIRRDVNLLRGYTEIK